MISMAPMKGTHQPGAFQQAKAAPRHLAPQFSGVRATLLGGLAFKLGTAAAVIGGATPLVQQYADPNGRVVADYVELSNQAVDQLKVLHNSDTADKRQRAAEYLYGAVSATGQVNQEHVGSLKRLLAEIPPQALDKISDYLRNTENQAFSGSDWLNRYTRFEGLVEEVLVGELQMPASDQRRLAAAKQAFRDADTYEDVRKTGKLLFSYGWKSAAGGLAVLLLGIVSPGRRFEE